MGAAAHLRFRNRVGKIPAHLTVIPGTLVGGGEEARHIGTRFGMMTPTAGIVFFSIVIILSVRSGGLAGLV